MRKVQNMFFMFSRKQWRTITVNCSSHIVSFPSIKSHKEGLAAAVVSTMSINRFLSTSLSIVHDSLILYLENYQLEFQETDEKDSHTFDYRIYEEPKFL